MVVLQEFPLRLLDTYSFPALGSGLEKIYAKEGTKALADFRAHMKSVNARFEREFHELRGMERRLIVQIDAIDKRLDGIELEFLPKRVRRLACRPKRSSSLHQSATLREGWSATANSRLQRSHEGR